MIAVARRLLSDVLTPVSAYRTLVRGDARLDPSFLFESVTDGDRVGRYSTLGSRTSASGANATRPSAATIRWPKRHD